MKNKLNSIIFHILLLVPFFFLISYVSHYFVDVYFWDTYALIPGLVDDLSLKWLFTLHNEHWIVFTKLIYFIQHKFFYGSNILIISLQIIIQIFLFYFIYFKIKKDIDYLHIVYKFLLFFVISVLLSSFQLAGIWHWGFAIQQQFTVLFFILSLEFYQRFNLNNRIFYYIVSIFFAISSAVSSANGLITIFAVFIFSLFFTNKNNYKIINFIVMLIVYTIFLFTYISVEKVVSSEVSLSTKNFFLYFLSFFGSPFSSDDIMISILMGFVGLFLFSIIFLTILKNQFYKNKDKIIYFLFILSVPLSSGFLAALGRSKYGLEQSLDSRYIIFSGLFWICLLILTILLNKEKNFIKRISKVWLISVIIIFTFIYINTKKQYEVYTAIQEDQKVQYLALTNGYYIYEPISVFSKLFPDSKKAYDYLNTLFKSNYHIFKNKNSLLGKDIKSLGYEMLDEQILNKNIEEIKYYSSELVADNLHFAYEFKGWAKVNNDLINNEVVVTNKDGIIVGLGVIGFSRKDVAQYLKINENNYGIRGFIVSSVNIEDHLSFYFMNYHKLSFIQSIRVEK